MKKIVSRWKSPTSKAVKWLQVLCGAIATLALYYTQMPEEWKETIPQEIIKYVSLTGFALTFILQFTKKK